MKSLQGPERVSSVFQTKKRASPCWDKTRWPKRTMHAQNEVNRDS